MAPRQPEGRRCGPSPSQAMAPRIQQMHLSVTNTPLLFVTLQLTPRITQKPFSPNPCAHQCLCMKELCHCQGVCTPGALKAQHLQHLPQHLPKTEKRLRKGEVLCPGTCPWLYHVLAVLQGPCFCSLWTPVHMAMGGKSVWCSACSGRSVKQHKLPRVMAHSRTDSSCGFCVQLGAN